MTTLRGMFKDAVAFNQPLESWSNTTKVNDMSELFLGATAFNQSLVRWDTSSLTDLHAAFSGMPHALAC